MMNFPLRQMNLNYILILRLSIVRLKFKVHFTKLEEKQLFGWQ